MSRLEEKFNHFSEAAKLAAENVDNIKDFTQSPAKINGEWYNSKTHVIEKDVETGQDKDDFINNVFSKLSKYIANNFEDENVYITDIDLSHVWAKANDDVPNFQKFDGVISRLVVENENYRADLKKIGNLSNFENEIRNHHQNLELNLENLDLNLGYSFGNVDVDNQLKDALEDLASENDKKHTSVFYFDVVDENSSIDVSEVESNGFDIEMKSRKFSRENDGNIYEII